ncbi:MAG TPA: nitric oxide reductase activation protein [Candidatus Methylomirabilis sp.]|nr:nitric oxide reductase activation protein [Candidatus Methylomirabilis sp.]
MTDRPLTAADLEARLDEALDAVLSSRRTAAPLAKTLAEFERAQQDFVLKWVDIITKTNAEMAYQFAARAPEAFRLLEPAAIEAWIIRAMDVYDKQGLYPGCSSLAQLQVFAAETAEAAHSIALGEIQHVLELFVHGLAGRRLKFEAGGETGTDTATLFLPARLGRFRERHDNFLLYKTTAAHLWAQVWHGTFRAPEGAPPLTAVLAAFPDPDRAQRLYHALETVRLNARIAKELPGLYRDMLAIQRLAGGIPYPDAWAAAIKRLARPEATVLDSRQLLSTLYDGDIPAPFCYQGALLTERAQQVMQERLAREQDQLRQALAHLGQESPIDKPATEGAAREPKRFNLEQIPDPDRPGHFIFTLSLDGQPIQPPADVRTLMDSIIQDLGQVPEDYLVAAGAGGYRQATEEKRPEDVWKGTYHEEGAFLYNEWDHRRHHYRKHWCVLREIDVHPDEEPFVARTLRKYSGVLAQLRKTFEALRGENRLLKKQINGDDVDFDALVEARADMKSGMEMSERLFTKLHKIERSIAVMFMVDMSGSTKGWINDAERESLVLLCEALEILGDRYAIYGFSGMTRKRCELYRIKRFDEAYGDEVRRRIAGIRPQDYTRMGVTIRHLTKLLNDVEARTKLLITLSDGKPDDYDGYRGEYGIEDTRMSLIEAKRAGIHPFCITIDETARAYLPHMYGAVNWTLVDDVRKLPLKVSDIYRRLTL